MAVGFQGIPELLKRLSKSGKSLAIVTSETSALSDYALKAFSLHDYFDALVTNDDVSKRKPDPEGIHLALKKIQLGPEDCMLVGDSVADIAAGKKAGLVTGAARTRRRSSCTVGRHASRLECTIARSRSILSRADLGQNTVC